MRRKIPILFFRREKNISDIFLSFFISILLLVACHPFLEDTNTHISLYLSLSLTHTHTQSHTESVMYLYAHTHIQERSH